MGGRFQLTREKNRYRITIHDIHNVDQEVSDTTMTVFGNLIPDDYGFTLRYLEQSGEMEGFATEIGYDADANTVSIRRRGDSSMELFLEEDKRHNCVYDLPEGRLIMGVSARKVNTSMSRFGGRMDLVYDIDFNAGFVSENTLEITVKEIF